METLFFKATCQFLSTNSHLAKSFQVLSRVTSFDLAQEKIKQTKDSNKLKCPLCQGGKIYEHVLLLILHIEITHPNQILKYSIGGDCVTAIPATNTRNFSDIGHGYLENLSKNSVRDLSSLRQSFYAKNKLEARVKDFLNTIIGKLERALRKKEQVYFHSADIFRQIESDSMGEDSEDGLGDVEKELEKLRIEDFGDVNQNDKKFFIEWNSFIHEKRRELQIVYGFQIPKIFLQFCQRVSDPSKQIPRINLVIHAWTLWSAGQITSNDVLKGLNAYDSHRS